MSEEEFQCRAINDYYASVTDELDLKEGQIYTIMQTSPSGWWYAVNEDGEDGWVPSNYLERIDDDGGAAPSSNANANASNANANASAAQQKNDDDDGDDVDNTAPVQSSNNAAPANDADYEQAKKNQTIVQPTKYNNIDDSAPGWVIVCILLLRYFVIYLE